MDYLEQLADIKEIIFLKKNDMKLSESPFDLRNVEFYQHWRQTKLENYPENTNALRVKINDPENLSVETINKIIALCRKTNMAIYKTRDDLDTAGVKNLAAFVGLENFDQPLYTGTVGVTSISVASRGRQGDYIPYSNKPLSWHTDGYYNTPDRQIRGMVLHCRRPATNGGISRFLDPEIAYIRLRDANPDWIRALMETDALIIPENRENGKLIRNDSHGPVFSVIQNKLHMRYSARKKYVMWKDNEDLTAARNFLTELLAGDEKYLFQHRLSAGEGMITNNVLHNRTAFTDFDDNAGRLFYRARFYDAVRKHPN